MNNIYIYIYKYIIYRMYIYKARGSRGANPYACKKHAP